MNVASPSADALVADARRHHAAGRMTEAQALYNAALRLQPKHPNGLHYLGVLCLQQNDPETALKLISRAIKARPDIVDMHLNLGAVYRKLGQPAQAAFAFRKALALQPGLAAARLLLGNALREDGNYDEAIAAYEAYLNENPDDARGHLGLGYAQSGARRYDAALAALDLAITLDPAFAEAYHGIAITLCARGHYIAAMPFHEQAVSLAPTVPEWSIEFALNLLRLEKFSEGWKLYDSRFTQEFRRILPHAEPPPYWKGEDLSGKNIRVWMEQGVGDQMLMAGMLPDVVAQAGQCVVECAPRLAPLFQRSFPTATIVPNPDLTYAASPAAGLDYQIAAGSLGKYLRRNTASFPRHGGYLKPDPARTRSLRARYETIAQGRAIIGLSWRTAAPDEAVREAKSIDLINLEPILKTEGCLLINLQYGDCRADLAKVKKQIGVDIYQDPDVDAFSDLDGLFAQVGALDLVVTTSNTTAHVAGAQNRPVWILLPAHSGLHWYWHLKRSDSPWYPSARLIRAQTQDLAAPWWKTPVEAAAEYLRAWLHENRV